MRKKGFTLIELLAVIIILAIIALITVPIISNSISNARIQSFKSSVNGVFEAYRVKESRFDNIGEVNVNDLKLSNSKFENGIVRRDSNNKIEALALSDGNYCANGTIDNLQIVEGDCGNTDLTPPIINSLTFTKTTSSITAIASFSEDGIIKNVEFSLMDSDNNLIKPYESYDLLSGTDEKVAKKTFNGLTAGATYKVEVKVTNNSLFENNYATLVGEVTLNTFDSPVITYNKNEWASNKNVTITYDSGLNNQYRIVDQDLKPITVWKRASDNETININRVDYTIQARSSDGVISLSTSEKIEKIDIVKPTLTISNNNIVWSNIEGIILSMSDDLSGIGSYCVINSEDISLCNWISVNNSLSVNAEYIFDNVGTYMVYAKDLAGNISLGKEVIVNKATGSVTAPTAKTLTYNGSAQALVNIGSSSTGTIQYKLEGGSYSATIPTGTNAGSYKVYYKVIGDSNHLDVAESSINVTINKANNVIALSSNTGTVTYPNTSTFTVTNNASGGTLRCSSSNNNAATCSISGSTVTVTPGTQAASNVTLTISSDATSNYNAGQVTYTLVSQNGILSYTANNYSGTYDGNAHTISVTSSGSTIKYGTTSGTYNLTSAPTYVNAGTYTVYYQVTKTGYVTVTGSKTVTINKALTASTGSCAILTYNGSSRTLASGGSYVSYSNNTATNAGSYTVTVTSDSNHLFSDGTSSKTLTCSIGISRTITYNANGGSGAPASQSCSGTASSNDASCNITISSTTPTRSGYDFLGWSTSSTATSASYNKGTTYGFTSNVTLYAIWRQSYRCSEGTLTYNATYGSSSGGYICVTNGTYGSHSVCEAGYVFYAVEYAWNCPTADGRSNCKSGALKEYYDQCISLGCSVATSHSTSSSFTPERYGYGDCAYTAGYGILYYRDTWMGYCSYDSYYCQNEYSYYCPSGWSNYSGSGSSLTCYKAATLN